MSQAKVLYDLQQIDTEIRTKKKRLGEVLQAQKEPATLVGTKEKAAGIEATLHKQRARHNDLTLELKGLNDKAKRSEERLYSGNVKNPKELADLQHEIEALGRRRNTLETESLEAMMAVEETQAARKKAVADVERLTADWQASVVHLKEEQQALAVRLNVLIGRRAQQAALAEPKMLQEYDRLIAAKNGLAVARLANNKCQGCQVTMPEHIRRDADQGKLVHCDSCGRLLYLV